MAGADYRSCDVCGAKTFYDANLSYEFEGEKYYDGPTRWNGAEESTSLGSLGAWAVLCRECAKTHDTVVLPMALADELRRRGVETTAHPTKDDPTR